MATSSIKNPMAWKLAGTASGGAAIDVPSDYNELMCVATGYSSYFFTGIIPKAEVKDSVTALRFGTIYNANNNSGGYWLVSNREVSIGSWQENSGSVNAVPSSICKLYYR